jgi:predicted metal-dependent HD superfamily phosphohydrolase
MKFNKAKKFILEKLEQELPEDLPYHSVEHIRDVYDSATQLAKEEGIEGDDLVLLHTAALFHDSGFLVSKEEHEKQSCYVTRKYLPDFGYTPQQIDIVCGMIMATQIPQKPHNILERIICDADLDYLGRDDFFTIGNKLFAELKMQGVVETENDWNKIQVGFLEKHHYFTNTAIKLRKNKKEEHLALVKAKLQ